MFAAINFITKELSLKGSLTDRCLDNLDALDEAVDKDKNIRRTVSEQVVPVNWCTAVIMCN